MILIIIQWALAAVSEVFKLYSLQSIFVTFTLPQDSALLNVTLTQSDSVISFVQLTKPNTYSLFHTNINSSLQLITFIQQTQLFNSQTLSFWKFNATTANLLQPQSFFAFSVFSSQVSDNKVTLPFNLPQINSSLFIIQSGTVPSVKFSQEPFLRNYWTQNNIQEVSMPWIPYINFCRNSGNKLLLHQIIQDQLHCKLTDYYKTVFFTGYPSSGQLVADSCSYQDQCFFQQSLAETLTNDPWYSLAQGTIFSISRKAVSAQQFLNGKKVSEWDKVSVQIKSSGYQQSKYPGQVQMQIRYFQKNQSEKTIVSAQISAHSFQDSPLYNFSLTFAPIQFLQAFDIGVFQIQVYFIYALGFSGVVLAFMELVRLTLLRCQRRYSKFADLLNFVLWPTVIGLLIYCCTYLSLTLIFYLISVSTNYSLIIYNFDGQQSAVTEQNQLGRNGLTLYICSFVMLQHAVNMAIPLPSEIEVKLIKRNIKKELMRNMQEEQDQNQQDNFLKEFQLSKVLEYKRKYVATVFFFLGLAMNFFFENLQNFRFVEFASVYIWVIPLSQLLILYFVRALAMEQYFFIFSALMAFDLLSCIFCYIGNTVIQICFLVMELSLVTLLGPLAVLILFQKLPLEKLIGVMQSCFNLQMLVQSKNQQQYSQNLQNYLELQERPKKKERAMRYMVLLQSWISVVVFKPLMFLFLSLTMDETKIDKTFNLILSMESISLIFVLLWSFVQLHIGLATIQLLDNFLQIGLTQLMQQLKHDYQNREVKWLFDVFLLNKHLQWPYRNLQKLCMSSQFHFFSYSVGISCLISVLSFECFLKQKYMPFQDPLLVLLIVIIFIALYAVKLVCQLFYNKFKLYQPQQRFIKKDPLDVVNLSIPNTYFSRFMKNDLVRKNFIVHNRKWLIQNIFKVVNSSAFYAKLPLFEKIYSRLHHDQTQAFRAKALKKLVNKKKYSNQTRFVPPKQNFIQITWVVLQEKLKKLLFYWLGVSRQFLYLKDLVKQEKLLLKQKVCKLCKLDIQLELYEEIPFKNLVNLFRLKILGLPFHSKDWISFYMKNQIFTTLCFDCLEKKVENKKVRLSSKQTQKKERLKTIARKICLGWLLTSRSRMIDKRINRPSSDNLL